MSFEVLNVQLDSLDDITLCFFYGRTIGNYAGKISDCGSVSAFRFRTKDCVQHQSLIHFDYRGNFVC